jgi:hypothetical protein
MIAIPVVRTETSGGELLSPSQPIPADAITIICDGEHYNVYQPGDTVPQE